MALFLQHFSFMGQGINILVLTYRKMWRDSLLLSVGMMDSEVCFFGQGDISDGSVNIDAVLIDATSLSNRALRRKVEKLWNLPVFILCAKSKKKKFFKKENVMGVFSKDVSARTLIQGIEMILDSAKEKSISTQRLNLAEKLVLDGVAKGYSNKQIARHYDIALSKVKYHLQHLYQKLGVSNRTQAALTVQKTIV